MLKTAKFVSACISEGHLESNAHSSIKKETLYNFTQWSEKKRRYQCKRQDVRLLEVPLHWCDNVINDVKLYLPIDTGLIIALLKSTTIRLGYCFTPYRRPWLYNGAPLVAFYDTLGIRRTYFRLKPPASSRGEYNEISNEQMTNCKFNALLWCKPTLIEADLDIQCGDKVLPYATIIWLQGLF